jgi:hypothetical protein
MSRRKAPEPTAIDALRSRGAALWKTLGQVEGSSAGAIALEACRTADRLDELDAIISGKDVLHLLMFRTRLDMSELLGDDDSRRVTVKIEVSNVLAEARQQAMALRNLLAELGIKATPVAPPRPAAANPLDQLTARRNEKAGGK